MIAQPFAQCNQQKKSRLENNQTAFIVSLQQNYTTIKKTIAYAKTLLHTDSVFFSHHHNGTGMA